MRFTEGFQAANRLPELVEPARQIVTRDGYTCETTTFVDTLNVLDVSTCWYILQTFLPADWMFGPRMALEWLSHLFAWAQIVNDMARLLSHTVALLMG